MTRTVEPIDDASCVVQVSLVGEPTGWRRVIQRSVIGAIRRSLEVDYTQAGGFFDLPVTFHGGGETGSPGDTLTITGGVFTDTVYTYTTNNNGTIDLDGTVLTYTGLEPITSTITATFVTLNYSGADETITITDPGSV